MECFIPIDREMIRVYLERCRKSKNLGRALRRNAVNSALRKASGVSYRRPFSAFRARSTASPEACPTGQAPSRLRLAEEQTMGPLAIPIGRFVMKPGPEDISRIMRNSELDPHIPIPTQTGATISLSRTDADETADRMEEQETNRSRNTLLGGPSRA